MHYAAIAIFSNNGYGNGHFTLNVKMSLIDRELTLDTKHIAKHLLDTPQMEQLLQKEGSVHIFNDEATMKAVAQAIIEKGEWTRTLRIIL